MTELYSSGVAALKVREPWTELIVPLAAASTAESSTPGSRLLLAAVRADTGAAATGIDASRWWAELLEETRGEVPGLGSIWTRGEAPALCKVKVCMAWPELWELGPRLGGPPWIRPFSTVSKW